MTDDHANEHATLLSQRSREGAAQGGTEADLRHHLWLFFQPWATKTLKLDQSALSHEGTGTTGRFDSRIGRAVIEYKSPGSLSSTKAKETAAEQGLMYIDDPVMAADVVIITDGSVWAHYRDASAEPEVGEQMSLELGSVAPPTTFRERFMWRDNGPESCARVLSLIETVRTQPVTAVTVGKMLGTSRDQVRALISAFGEAVANRQADDRTDILFRQWIQLAGVSYGIEDPEDPWPSKKSATDLLGDQLAAVLGENSYAEALFCLHTYVALASKLIGTELLSLATAAHEMRPTAWASLPEADMESQFQQLENGHISDQLHAPGLLAGDLFGWYASVILTNEKVAERLRDLLVVFGELAWARVTNSARGITGDLLRDFYGSVVPRALRRALGEFFTPQWLAERTLVRGIDLAGKTGEAARVLDPSCGSGTFLVAALSRELVIQDRLNPEERGRATLAALESVIGFDINPVAVLMSRINLLLALGDRIESLTSVTPRVYQADSILLPDPVWGEVELRQQGDFRRLPLTIGNIDIPTALATLEGLHALRSNIESGVENGRSAHTFSVRLKVDLTAAGLTDSEIADSIAAADEIYTLITDLHLAGKDGVWARIIEQSFAPATLMPVDLVVGNPPWINWKHLPDPWQERSKPVWKGWGLWATKSKGGGIPLADIATLLVARSVVTYAEVGAVVAFLLPEALLIADPGNELIRGCVLRPADKSAPGVEFCPLAVDDWTKIKPFAPDAANLPIGLYLKAEEAPAWPIPKTLWSRAKAGQRLKSDDHWGQVAPLLASEVVEIRPVERDKTGSPWVATEAAGGLPLLPKGHASIAYTWGQGFHTHGMDGRYVYEVLSATPDPHGLVEVRNVPGAGKNTKSDPVRVGTIEAKFLWPLVRGANVQPFAVDPTGLYALMPHDPADPNRYLTVDELIAVGPRLYDYLEPWIVDLAARFDYGKLQPSLDYPFGVRGPTEHLSRLSPVVLSRYMHPAKRPPAAVAVPKLDTKLGLVTTCYPNNKSNVHVPKSLNEARFLAGWLNSPSALDAVARVASSTTIGPTTLHRLPIPKFDPANEDHARIVEIAESAETVPLEDLGELDALVQASATIIPSRRRRSRPAV